MAVLKSIFGIISLMAVAANADYKPPNPVEADTNATQFLGRQRSTIGNWTKLYRDGGYESQLGDKYYQVYSDMCIMEADQSTDCTTFRSNGIALQTDDPTIVQDFNERPSEFCHTFSGGRAHLSSIVPIGKDSGAMWYIQLGKCDSNPNGCATNNGLALVYANGTSQPTCSVLYGWWDIRSEPQWGGSSAVPPSTDSYLHLYGSLDSSLPGGNLSNLYVARVLPEQVTNIGAYEYWNGDKWSSERLRNPVHSDGSAPAAVLENVHISSIYYNKYYSRYIALSGYGGRSIAAWTAEQPQGPWSDPVRIWFNETYGLAQGLDRILYAPMALPHRDPSGKSLTVALSRYIANNIEVVLKIPFI